MYMYAFVHVWIYIYVSIRASNTYIREVFVRFEEVRNELHVSYRKCIMSFDKINDRSLLDLYLVSFLFDQIGA